MKETGLMFKAPLVRAILDGQKTQTRRPVAMGNSYMDYDVRESRERYQKGGN